MTNVTEIKAIVISKGKKRKARGFSIEELKQAGLSLKKAKKLGIYIDKRRKSIYEENVQLLKNLIVEKFQTKPNASKAT